MIDYDKLKLAHEIAKNLPYSWYCIDAVQGTGACTNYYSLTFEDNESMSHEYEFKHDEIDDLIAKIRKLTKPEPKYKIQALWFANDDEIVSFVPTSIRFDSEANQYCYWDRIWDVKESQVFPTREALIEHQINYWQSLHPDNKLQVNDGGIGYASPFVAKLDRPLTNEEQKIFQEPAKFVQVCMNTHAGESPKLKPDGCTCAHPFGCTGCDKPATEKSCDEPVTQCKHEWFAIFNSAKEESIVKCAKCGKKYNED